MESTTPRWRRTLSGFGVDARPGEGASAFMLFLCFFLFITFQYATKSVRQSTFIDALGASKLPYVYLLVALCSYPFLRLYVRYADRLARHRLIAATCSVIMVSMIGFWWLYQYPWPWVRVAFYIWVSIVFVMTVSQFWSYANHVFDPRQAKRLFGFLGAGGLLGGIAGGQVARFATALVGTRHTLLVSAVILLSVIGLVHLIHRMQPASNDAVAGASGLAHLDQARGGFDAIRRSRHLQMISALMILCVMVAQVVDLQFNWAVEQVTTGLNERTAFFGNFYSVMGISAFLFQIIFTARIHRTLGVGTAMRTLPTTMALGTGMLFVAAGMFPALLISAAVVLKVGENGLRYSLDQSTRELLFLPVPSRARVKAKAFIDVFIQRGAKGLAALVLLPVTFGLFSPVQAGWISLGLIVVWLIATVAARREYVQTFRSGLKQRTVDASVPINLDEVTTLELVVQSLGSVDRRQVLHGLDILSSHGRGNLVPPLLLYHDDAEVRRRTLEVLCETDRQDAAPLIERRLGDDDPDVRAEAVRVLARFRGQDACALMIPRLTEADAGVRAAAVACLANHGDEAMVRQATAALSEMLSDADPGVRGEAIKAIGAIADAQFDGRLVSALYDPDARVAREAIAAVCRRVARDGFSPLYAPTLISLLQNRRLKHDCREALVAFGEPVVPALVHFMNDSGESIWVRRALPKTIASVGGDAAVRALVDSIGKSADAFLRRKIVEALASRRDEVLAAGGLARIENGIRDETERYLTTLAVLAAVESEDHGRHDLLSQMLDERSAEQLNILFHLLALLFPPRDVWAAHRSLTGRNRALRTHALEYLDNTLSGDVRRNVFCVIDDLPPLEKLRRAEKQFGVRVESRIESLRAILRANGASQDAATLAVAGLYRIYADRVVDLYPEVERILEEPRDHLVRETADWVSKRMKES